jgi:hypothetical protein
LNLVPKELVALTFFTVNLLEKYLLNTPGLLIADFITVGKELLCNNLSDLHTSIINDGGTMVRLEIFDKALRQVASDLLLRELQEYSERCRQ